MNIDEAIKAGCQCSTLWYGNPIEPICSEYVEDYHTGYCSKCEHNEECHDNY